MAESVQRNEGRMDDASFIRRSSPFDRHLPVGGPHQIY